MHLLRTQARSLDETVKAVDLDQTTADVVFLSFTDADLSVVAAAWRHSADHLPSLRLASLAQLKHPFSVDLYVEKVAAQARFVLVRLLGGLDYWRYGVEELAAAARTNGFVLAVVPGDHMADGRLDAASTLAPQDLARIWGYFQEGGPDNIGDCLNLIATLLGSPRPHGAPRIIAPFGLYEAGRRSASPAAPCALIILYRSALLAADTAPILALADALAAQGFRVASAYVTSLKDAPACEGLGAWLKQERPDVILNTTAFSARQDRDGSVLDAADVPVFQVILAGATKEQWQDGTRGLGAGDLAMNVVLPEIDGRIVSSAISFKGEAERHDALEFTRFVHRPEPSRVDFVARLTRAWAELRQAPRHSRRIACILSDYPGKGGRTGYAVGLDTPSSVLAIAERLRADGFDLGALPPAAVLMEALRRGAGQALMPLAEYERLLEGLPQSFAAAVRAAWGFPADDPAASAGAFGFGIVRSGKFVICVQPDRGHAETRKSDYHDPVLPPRHAYVAFYLWLRERERVHAIIHCGTHGTLEWLPGKAVALSRECAPEAVLGAVPVIYPFIVNNPGEAAQAKRRIAAVTIGHLTPPLTAAGSHGAAAELEALFDEYAQAEGLDARRARMLAQLILDRAREVALLEDAGIAESDPRDALLRLDAWLCDLKEMRIADGLHVFGTAPEPSRRQAMLDSVAPAGGTARTDDVARRIENCASGEMDGLLRALDGRFVAPGPAGAPSRGRLDVLPTGRNLFTIDPRAVPTRTAWEIGRRNADEVVRRYVQDHGEWPRRIVLDLWGSATMRTGGDDLAQALALLGVRPVWDDGSTRVSGFALLPLASLGRPRVDVTLRLSGLFRDVFPAQIALLDEAVRAVAGLDEPGEENPLAGATRSLDPAGGARPRRIFGGAPGQYGIGLTRRIAGGEWSDRDQLGEAYLQSTSHAYGAGSDASPAGPEFRERVAAADAFVHVQDMSEQDVLDADAFAEHEGGFAAAAALLGGRPTLYHADGTRPDALTVRQLPQEIARVLRARATNPRWIEGQMRHGHRGAAEIAETLDNLFAFAALTDAVPSRHFELLFDATCGNERVRDFLLDANREAAWAMAERFAEAIRRGLWTPRRNSVAAILADMGEVAR
ncbi:MAG: cobaltochelatase subunit CobN [Methylobacteriaceae bacterium]|nr:cobaltochelatase subunit CobN [Methylobacteriaceae bacterium]